MRQTVILHAEDNEDEAFLLRCAFDKSDRSYSLLHVPDGQTAIEYLSGSKTFSNRAQHPFPDALLLDLKMPRRDGFEVLRWLREQAGVPRMPVVILSSSERPEDKELAFRLGASAFVTKSFDWSNIVQTLAKVAAADRSDSQSHTA